MIFNRLLFDRYLEKNEILVYSIHRHWITVHSQMIRIALFGYILPLLVLIFIAGFFSPLSYVCYAWILIVFFYTIYAFLDWYLDAWLVTNTSIISTAWDGFFKQSSSRIEFESVESVDIDQAGIKQSLLDFGNIHLIRSSGLHVHMESVSRPKKAASILSKVQSQIMMNKGAQNSEAIKGLLADIIQDHIRVHSS
ncbi:MAG: hypothetical protein Q8O95_02485 [bacterium]|nr:hypothetical protein [bacterium]